MTQLCLGMLFLLAFGAFSDAIGPLLSPLRPLKVGIPIESVVPGATGSVVWADAHQSTSKTFVIDVSVAFNAVLDEAGIGVDIAMALRRRSQGGFRSWDSKNCWRRCTRRWIPIWAICRLRSCSCWCSHRRGLWGLPGGPLEVVSKTGRKETFRIG